ncbi:hypothetical protein M378DRAFT_162937 [Amanita muscaria Koide BX008]|uniref:Uncharacterized protein n=1 Tax=Amanita muscaria (strain Koide BX008) TaxID=946122 RepID=A0A0C2SNG3_AMAMK|nr:hypothetical protein M378DRAFT_162937 [Amanita muscaria Koide BX008]
MTRAATNRRFEKHVRDTPNFALCWLRSISEFQKMTPGGGGAPPSHPIRRIANANQNIVAMKISNPARANGDGVGCRKRTSGLYGDKGDEGFFSSSSV